MGFFNKIFLNKDYEEITPASNFYSKKLNRIFSLGIILLSVLGITLYCIFGINYSQSHETLHLSSNSEINHEDSIITTSLGKILGKKMLSRDGREFLGFLGVPYAKPPLGNLRFAPPKEIEPWDGILNATQVKTQCMQQDSADIEPTEAHKIIGSEDCLYLYIYTPKKVNELKKKEPDDMFPVIFYIHGAKYTDNGSRYGAEYFMDEKVVLVLPDFRMHVFANLNTEDEASRGNFGLKDQVMALKWIQQNIMYFGGNPEKVTIYGNSAGSMYVSTHLISPMSSGLFHRAIMQSGIILWPGEFVLKPKKVAYNLGAKMGCENNSSTQELVDCLRKIGGRRLTRVIKDRNLNFGISVEKNAPIENSIIIDSPLTLLEKGLIINRVPSIQGVTSSERLKYALAEFLNNGDYPLNKYNGSWDAYLKEILHLRHAEHPYQITRAAHEYYFNNSKNLTRDNLIELLNMESDNCMHHPLSVYTLSQLETYPKNTPIFLYVVTKVPLVSIASKNMELYGAKQGSLGVAHGDDFQYYFQTHQFPKITQDSPYYNFSKYVVKMYANFAETGDPNKEDEKKSAMLKNEYWHPVKSLNDKNQWFNLGDDPKMFEPTFKARIKFWDQFNPTDLYP